MHFKTNKQENKPIILLNIFLTFSEHIYILSLKLTTYVFYKAGKKLDCVH